MRIAFVSQEFPPETGGGGISTYLAQITSQLAQAGHSVEVFCGAGPRGDSTGALPEGGRVWRIAADGAEKFRARVLPVFAAVHRQMPFDVLEGTDFDAPALEIRRALPDLPCVVKLHTPRFAVDELHAHPPSLRQRGRLALGALLRGHRPRWTSGGAPRSGAAARAELAMLEAADEIAAPSQAVAAAARTWLPGVGDRISVFPYPYAPSPALLAIPAGSATRRITFLGRIEERKGVYDLARAIPAVLQVEPTARFRFVGRNMPAAGGGDTWARLGGLLGAARAAVEWTGAQPPEALPRILEDTALLVAPSHWESFGLVCCEGLAAARAVIGSTSGGMPEILDQGRCGVLVPPKQPSAIAGAILDLLADPASAQALGEQGRQHVLARFHPSGVLDAQLASYARARRRAQLHCR